MKMQEPLIPQGFPISICFAEDSLVKLFQSLENGEDLTTQEARYSLKLLESLPLSDLNILCLKMYPDCYRMTKAGRIRPSSVRYRNWGIMQHGLCLTARISVSPKTESACSLSDILEKDVPDKYYLTPKQTLKILIKLLRDVKESEYTLQTVSQSQSQATPEDLQVTPESTLKLTVKVKNGILLSWEGDASYFIDLNFPPTITPDARCITARHNSGISNRKGEHSGVLELTDIPSETEEPDPMAIMTPDRENVRQNGLRVKVPNKPMFTLTVTDVHGVIEKGCRIRKLMPIECWRLQGFTDEQFYKAQATGLKDGRLYKMAGNAVSVPVISALGDFIKRMEADGEEQERSEQLNAENN